MSSDSKFRVVKNQHNGHPTMTAIIMCASIFLTSLPALGQYAPGARGPVPPQPTPPVVSQATGYLNQNGALSAVQAAASAGDVGALRGFLRDSDISVQTAAFDALAAGDSVGAVNDLMAVVNDSGAAGRLSALQILSSSVLTDDQAGANAVRGAADSGDSSLGDYPMQELARRDHPDDNSAPNTSSSEPISLDGATQEEVPAGTDVSAGDAPAPAPPPSEEPQPPASAPSNDHENAAPSTSPAQTQESQTPIDPATQFRDTSLPVADRLRALQLVDQLKADEDTVIAVLREGITDNEPSLRACAVQSLARRVRDGSTAALEALREGLHNSDPKVRLLVVQSLDRSEAALPLLREAVSDSDKDVSAAATNALDRAPDHSPATEPAQATEKQ